MQYAKYHAVYDVDQNVDTRDPQIGKQSTSIGRFFCFGFEFQPIQMYSIEV